jgi:MFS family permease
MEERRNGYTELFAVETETENSYPEGGLWAWLVVLASVCTHMISIGIINTFGVYFEEYLDPSSYEGTHSIVAIAFIGSLMNGCIALFGNVIGRLIDRFGQRLVCCFGALLLLAASIAASFSTHYWHLILTQGLLCGIGIACIYFSGLTIIGHYFRKRKGL